MPRIEINGKDHQVVVDDPNGQRGDVARAARKLYAKTKPSGSVGFQQAAVPTAVRS